jgi:threonyl-tRNA synthetase
MFALLEKAATDSKAGKNPVLPLWLSPIQVRFCPVNDDYIEYCERIMKELEKNEIRVDIDDRVERIQKKIRDAEMEWIPFIVVVGQKEKESGKLAVRIRETGEIENISLIDLIEKIRILTCDYPFKALSIPKFLTKRPRFV